MLLNDLQWPLRSNMIRRNSTHNTFGMVRIDAHTHLPRPHQGWDLYAAVGTPCYAVADGVVKRVAKHKDYGMYIVIECEIEGTKYYPTYCHLSYQSVSIGKTVGAGQLIGYTGNSGNAKSMTGDDEHLHFEVRLVADTGRGLSGRIDPYRLYKVVPLTNPVFEHRYSSVLGSNI